MPRLRPMIVVSLTSEVFYPALPGGFAQYFRYGPGLRDRGVQLRIHTALRPEHGEETELLVNGIEVLRHPVTEGSGPFREREELVGHALRRMHADPRGVKHCIQPNVLSWNSNARLWRAKLDGVPSVFYSMMFPEDAPRSFGPLARHKLRWAILRATFNRMIVCSERMRAAYHEIAGLPLDQMTVLPNGVDLERFSPGHDRLAFRAKLGLPAAAPIVVTCGSVVPRKGVDVLLDAWDRVVAAIPGALMVICGSVGVRPTFGDPEMRRELVDFTARIEQRLEGNASVRLAGEVEAVEEYHRAADLFVFPSRREGLPNAVLEAMASGLPCVVSPFAGIPDDGEEFGDDGRHFVRSSHDPQVLADDLIGMLKAPERRAAMGAEARRLMELTQPMKRAIDTLEAIYRGVFRDGA